MKIFVLALFVALSCATVLQKNKLSLKQVIKQNEIEFELVLNGTDVYGNFWVGIGFGESMTETDMIICNYYLGQTTCTDNYSVDNEVPVLDTVMDGENSITTGTDFYRFRGEYRIKFKR